MTRALRLLLALWLLLAGGVGFAAVEDVVAARPAAMDCCGGEGGGPCCPCPAPPSGSGCQAPAPLAVLVMPVASAQAEQDAGAPVRTPLTGTWDLPRVRAFEAGLRFASRPRPDPPPTLDRLARLRVLRI